MDFDNRVGADRISKDNYYLNIARAVSMRSTCLRRQYGAVIVKNDRIVSTGYNGAAIGEPNCCDVGQCWRELNNIPHGERYEELGKHTQLPDHLPSVADSRVSDCVLSAAGEAVCFADCVRHGQLYR